MPIALDRPEAGLGGPATDRSNPSTAFSSTPASLVDDWRQYKSTGSTTSRNRLVDFYMSTHVRPIAARLHAGLPHQVELDDLIQQGYLGLIDAMHRFQLDRDTRFETFSRQRIYGAVQDYLRSIDPVPRLSRTRSKRVQAARERFLKEHGRPPTDDELRPLLGVCEPTFRRFLADRQPAAMVPFSNVPPPVEEDFEADSMDAFEDRADPGPVRHAERRDLWHWITRGFDPRDRLIIILYYYEHLTMREIGKAIGISESRVSQRIDSILARLKARLAANATEF